MRNRRKERGFKCTLDTDLNKWRLKVWDENGHSSLTYHTDVPSASEWAMDFWMDTDRRNKSQKAFNQVVSGAIHQNDYNRKRDGLD